eukprot:606052-Amphidinium_carterae.1
MEKRGGRKVIPHLPRGGAKRSLTSSLAQSLQSSPSKKARKAQSGNCQESCESCCLEESEWAVYQGKENTNVSYGDICCHGLWRTCFWSMEWDGLVEKSDSDECFSQKLKKARA